MSVSEIQGLEFNGLIKFNIERCASSGVDNWYCSHSLIYMLGPRCSVNFNNVVNVNAVSYTHLDVYKRQTMNQFLDIVFPTLTFKLPFLYKYMDDIITCIPYDQHDTILSLFNSKLMGFERIQFTIEHEQNSSCLLYTSRCV